MRRRLDDSDDEIHPKKRVASNGNKLPDPIRIGEILEDLSGNKWRLGRSIGIGGFGEIYLASDDTGRPVSSDTQYVVKVEDHSSGPLFVEMNCYIRIAKSDMISNWQKRKKLKHLGLSRYIGSGSHFYRDEKYRFLVLDRFSQDLHKLFLKSKRKFHIKTVLYIGMQILDVLEYIHSKGYIHADVKDSNIMIGFGNDAAHKVYLVDFGLACRYRNRDGSHKEFNPDERRAHDGTIEFTSRDAHEGAHSRRGDLEVLGYNMLQWLCSKLPWEDDLQNPEYVHEQKKKYMSNIPMLLKQCFLNSDPPGVLCDYFKYVNNLHFETEPNYDYCRKLLHKAVIDSGFIDDHKLEFGCNVCPRMRLTKVNKKISLVKFSEYSENQFKKKKKFVNNVNRQPCVAQNFNRSTRNTSAPCVVLRSKQFSWEKILQSNPELLLKQSIPRNNTTKSAKAEFSQVQRVKPIVPTPAMQEVMERIKERQFTQTVPGRRNRSDSSRCSSPTEVSSYPFTLTPAMEQVARRREELLQQEMDYIFDDPTSYCDYVSHRLRFNKYGRKRRTSPRLQAKT